MSNRGILYFRKDNRRAIVALCGVAIVCLAAFIGYDAVNGRDDSDTVCVDEDRMKKADGANSNVTFIDGTVNDTYNKAIGEVEMHVFDPNTVDSLTLMRFGLSERKVRNFLHYRAAGAVFGSAEDMGRTYGWSEEDVDRLAPYVVINAKYRRERNIYTERRAHDGEITSKYGDGSAVARKSAGKFDKGRVGERYQGNGSERDYPAKYTSMRKLNLNDVDTTELRRVPGIGQKISNAIVAYRNKLGGFVSVEQMMDISIVSPELMDWFYVEKEGGVKQLNINKASFQALNAHPYISYSQTKDIMNYRRLYGDITSLDKLKSLHIFSDEELTRLRPYIAF